MIISRIDTIQLPQFPHHLWVKVFTEDGQCGLGETYYVPSAVAAAIHDLAAPYLLGKPFATIERHVHDLMQIISYFGYAGAEMRAVSALDIALWDLLGKRTGQPIYQLLGGRFRDRLPIYNTCASYGQYRDHEAFLETPGELARELLSAGITAMKVWPFDRHSVESDGQRITATQIKEACAVLEAIRSAVGDNMDIAVECHGCWNLPSAIKIARALEAFDVLWLEDPIAQPTADGLRRLVDESDVPIAASERLFTRFAYREILERQAVHVVIPDVVWTGGISEALKIATMAGAYHLPVSFHDCTGPVTVMAGAHLSIHLPNSTLIETVRSFYHGYYSEIIEPTLDIRSGFMYLPDSPGLGIRLRDDVLDRTGAVVRSTSTSDVAGVAGHGTSYRGLTLLSNGPQSKK